MLPEFHGLCHLTTCRRVSNQYYKIRKRLDLCNPNLNISVVV